jgi:site-specific DNA-methyltransferase (adenine-specific)
VLDPFAGSGTALQVAEQNGCKAVGIEINPGYCRLIEARLRQAVLDFGDNPNPP